jgi:hypothetical protein
MGVVAFPFVFPEDFFGDRFKTMGLFGGLL